MFNNRNTPRYLVMLEMPLSTTPTMTKSVSKTIKTISRGPHRNRGWVKRNPEGVRRSGATDRNAKRGSRAFWNFAEKVSTVSKTIKTRAGRFEWKSERSAKGCGLYANGRIMIGRSYLASRRVVILPKATELAFRYCLGTSARRNGSLCVLRPVATFASRLRNVPAGSEYVYRPIRCVSYPPY